MLSFGAPGIAQEAEEHVHASPWSEEGLGRVHMEISCSPAVAAKFDRALALLHNFWYGRALEGFQLQSKGRSNCFDSESSTDETYARRGRHGSLGAALQHIRQFPFDLQQAFLP